ncbi:MAG: helix-turn-helix domain-containing protein [Saprospiraceae bacterium]|nr:helix-turn-helix domain-containing protein [Saprospiraceae bacterium]MBK8826581.1 helix-turn-helix domain-containing protein [Saprospiraceae bacterium]
MQEQNLINYLESLVDKKLEKQSDAIVLRITNFLNQSKKEDLSAKEWLSSKETETLLKISAVTRWEWSKKGILNAHKIGSRLRYRKDEVLQALIKIESKKGLR